MHCKETTRYLTSRISIGQEEFIVGKFHQECRILSQLKHPNVVGFVGVHCGCDKNDISLIMERLHCDLADFVKKIQTLPYVIESTSCTM